MSYTSAIGNYNLNYTELTKPLQFPDGSVQTTAGGGGTTPSLVAVLTAGNNAGALSIDGVNTLTAGDIITDTISGSGNTISFNANSLTDISEISGAGGSLDFQNTNLTNIESIAVNVSAEIPSLTTNSITSAGDAIDFGVSALTTTGAISGASVTATGAISGASVTTTNFSSSSIQISSHTNTANPTTLTFATSYSGVPAVFTQVTSSVSDIATISDITFGSFTYSVYNSSTGAPAFASIDWIAFGSV